MGRLAQGLQFAALSFRLSPLVTPLTFRGRTDNSPCVITQPVSKNVLDS